MFGNTKQPDPLSRYEDPTGGFSSRDLRLATWYVAHKAQLWTVFVICFSLFDAVLIGYGFFGWGQYLTVGYRDDRALYVSQTYEFPNYEAMHAQYGARPLQFAPIDVYPNDNGRYDFALDVQNSNSTWMAVVTYHFTYRGGQTPTYTVPIMPGTREPLIALGVVTNGFPGNPTFVPEAVEWKHINRHDIPDPTDFLKKRNVFAVSDVEFVPASETGTGAHNIAFELENASVFSFWSGMYVVEFRDLDRRVGVAQLTIDQFEAGEIERVDLRSFAPSIFVSDVVVHPQINFFDRTQYMY